MASEPQLTAAQNTFLRRHPVVAYFVLTFALSWSGALAVAAPHLIHRETLPKIIGLLMFPAMLLGPSLVGMLLARTVDGKSGLRLLLSQIFRVRVSARWYAALLIPPLLVLTVLLLLERFVSSIYAPNRFWLGILFGVPAGFLEEIGWSGYAFPKMRSHNDALTPSILLGLLWGLWHLPVVDYLGTATPHGAYRLPFFFVFTAAMTAMRVIIAWIYTNTKSVFLAQLMHVSSTGSLVVFSPSRVTAGQEVLWYGLYSAVLWLGVGVLAKTFGKRLTRLCP
jgi:membrane protease YdiL (CAAX protease family)